MSHKDVELGPLPTIYHARVMENHFTDFWQGHFLLNIKAQPGLLYWWHRVGKTEFAYGAPAIKPVISTHARGCK